MIKILSLVFGRVKPRDHSLTFHIFSH